MAVQNFEELKEHIGHKIECVYYGEKQQPVNVSLECINCQEVLLDYDKE